MFSSEELVIRLNNSSNVETISFQFNQTISEPGTAFQGNRERRAPQSQQLRLG